MQTDIKYYNNGHGWRVGFYFQGVGRILTVEQATKLRNSLSWALDRIASQPIAPADGEKCCGCEYLGKCEDDPQKADYCPLRR